METPLDETGIDRMDPIMKMTRDLKAAAENLEPFEARYLTDYYYQLQNQRIRARNQQRSGGEGEPNEIISWLANNTGVIERNIKSALGVYAASDERGQWALLNHGIGPVISAGLVAHVDMAKTRSVSALWSFAGLNPTAIWGKGEKRPWNARLKVLCYHAGESFKRTSGSDKSFYGPIYRKRKELEVKRNEAGQNEEVALRTIKEKKFRKDTDTYKAYAQGKLPAGRLDLRATRCAVKLFLSHFWQISYEIIKGQPPPVPWILTQEPHTQLIAPPNWPMK